VADLCSNATSSIFSTAPGRVAAVQTDSPVMFTFSIEATDRITSFFPLFKSIVNNISVQAQGGYQFLHTLSDFIYLYTFNERVGEIMFSGLAFAGTCDDQLDEEETGIEKLILWYEQERATVRKQPIIITLGTSVSYTAFLTSMKMDIVNPENAMAQFAMRFNFIPRFKAQACVVQPVEELGEPEEVEIPSVLGELGGPEHDDPGPDDGLPGADLDTDFPCDACED